MRTHNFFNLGPVERRLMRALTGSLLIHALVLTLVPGYHPVPVKPPTVLHAVLRPLEPAPAAPDHPAPETRPERPAKQRVLRDMDERDKMPRVQPIPTPAPAVEAPAPWIDTGAAVPAPEPVLSVPVESDSSSARFEVPAPRPAVAAPARLDGEAAAGYGESLSRTIAKHRRYPRVAQLRGWQGTVRVEIYVGQGDTVERVTLAESSGFGVLDEEALGMVRRAMPLPPPPKSLRGREFVVSVPIEFKLSN